MLPKVPFASFWILIHGPLEKPVLKCQLCLLGEIDFFGNFVIWWLIFTRPNNTPVTFVKNCWWFHISWLRKVKCGLGKGVGGLRRNTWALLCGLISYRTFIAVVDCNMIWLFCTLWLASLTTPRHTLTVKGFTQISFSSRKLNFRNRAI